MTKTYTSFEASTVNNVTKGQIIEEDDGRLIMCKGFALDELNLVYVHWQYVLRKTLKPSGKSLSFYRPLLYYTNNFKK